MLSFGLIWTVKFEIWFREISKLGTCFCTWPGQSGSNSVFPAARFSSAGCRQKMEWRKKFQPTRKVWSWTNMLPPLFGQHFLFSLLHCVNSGSTLSHWGHQPEDFLPRSGGPVLFRKRPAARGVESCAWDRLDVSAFRLNRFNRVSMILAFYIHSWENAAWVSIFFRVQFPRKKCNNPKTIANMHLFQSKIEAYKKLANFHPRAKKNIYIHIYISITLSISHSMCFQTSPGSMVSCFGQSGVPSPIASMLGGSAVIGQKHS